MNACQQDELGRRWWFKYYKKAELALPVRDLKCVNL